MSVVGYRSGSMLLLLCLCLLSSAAGKVFQRCELAQLLQQQYGLPRQQAATLVCIAQHSSGLNTAAFGGGSGPGGGSHGLFQISDVYWCSPPGQGAGCGLSCARLRDDDISDDVQCMRKIFAEHLRISGDGFTAWQAYQAYCQQDAASYVADCGQLQAAGTRAITTLQQQQQHYPQQPHYPQQQQHQGKIYNRCELAQELYYQHKLPMQQIPTWVCIAQHESSFNTAAVGRLNADGSADHGLFQISDLYWCTHERRGKGCHSSCEQFLDTSIADDVQCIRRIHEEHTHISGDGFNAWTVYNRNCRHQRYEQVAACFAKPPAAPATHPNAIAGGGYSKPSKLSYAQPTAVSYYKPVSGYQRQPQPVSYQPNPFLPRPRPPAQSHPNAIAGYQVKPQQSHANPFYKYQQPKPAPYTHLYIQPQPQAHFKQQQQQHFYHTPSRQLGKVYTRCELAQELYYSHKFPMQQLATWVCIAEHESRFNTAAVGRLNADGSADHGLFQISDLYWCAHEPAGGKACNIACDKLLDADITDDVQCIRRIHEEHTRLSGDGFNAWTVYQPHCRQQSKADIASCFDQQVQPQTQLQPVKPRPQPKSKLYSRCELAQELYYQHKLPMQQIPTWVCIAEHESSYNTAAVGRLNADGSADHGLFQISDLYWCAHEPAGGKACNIACDKLLDADITDDVQCIRRIHEEHTRLSGDGFNAWTVYQPHCRQQSLAALSDCFKGNEIAAVQQHHAERPQLKPQQRGNPFLPLAAAATATKAAGVAVHANTLLPVKSTQLYAANPFLAHLQPQTLAQRQPKPQLLSAVPAKSSYDSNPFLNGLFSKPLTTVKATAPSHKQQQAVVNPFLHKLNAAAESNTKPPSHDKPISNYIVSDSFRPLHSLSTTTTTARPVTSRTTTLKAPLTRTKPTTTARPITRPTTTRLPTTTVRSFAYTWPTYTTRQTTRSTTATIRQTTHPTTVTVRETTRPTPAFVRQTTRPTTAAIRQTTRPTTATVRQTTSSIALPSTIATKTTYPTQQHIQPIKYVTRSTQATRQTTRSTPTTRQTTNTKQVIQQARQTTIRPTLTTYGVAKTTSEFTRLPTPTRQTNTYAAQTNNYSNQYPRQTTHPTQPTRQTTRITTRQTTTRQTNTHLNQFTRQNTQATRQTTRLTTRQTTTPPSTQATRQTVRPAELTRQPTRQTTRSTTAHTTASSKVTTRQTTRWPTTSRTSARPFSTTRPHSTAWSWSTTPRPLTALRSTTPRPYLFSSPSTTTTTTRTTAKAATTRRPAAELSTTADPFSHPFFDQFRALFTQNRLKATPSTTALSPYYAKFQQNQATTINQSIYAYQIGRNHTTTTTRRPTNQAAAKPF